MFHRRAAARVKGEELPPLPPGWEPGGHIADPRETFSGITITQEGSGDDTKRTMNVMFERPFFSSALKRLFREHTKYELNFAELQCLRDAFPSMKRVG